MERFSQKQKLSTNIILWTLALIALFVFLAVYAGERIGYTKAAIWPLCMVGIIFLAIFLCNLWFVPVRVSVDDDEVCIAFPMRRKSFLLCDIEKAESCLCRQAGFKQFIFMHLKPYGKYAIRMFGNGGYFGLWGNFWNEELGSFFVYATDFDHLLYIKLKNGKQYVISSPDPEILAEEIRMRITK